MAVSYLPPSWASHLRAPVFRLLMLNGVTPIQKFPLPGLPTGWEVFIKRDDMTGVEVSGNKVRINETVPIIGLLSFV